MIKARIKRADDQGTPPKEWAAVDKTFALAFDTTENGGEKKCYFSKLTSSNIKLLFVVNFSLLGTALSFIVLPSFLVQISTSNRFFLQPHKTETSRFPLHKFPDSPMRDLSDFSNSSQPSTCLVSPSVPGYTYFLPGNTIYTRCWPPSRSVL